MRSLLGRRGHTMLRRLAEERFLIRAQPPQARSNPGAGEGRQDATGNCWQARAGPRLDG